MMQLKTLLRSTLFGCCLLFTTLQVGCGGTTSPGPDGGSSMQSCTEQHSCMNGACKCDEGPKKDQSCCAPDDSSCSGTKCDELCKVCK